MADRLEQHLKPIKDICKEIIKDEEIGHHVDKLKEIAKKGDFFEAHSVKELLSVIPTVSNDLKKVENILTFANEVLNKSNTKNYLMYLHQICRCLADSKPSLDVQRIFIEKITFQDIPMPSAKILEILLYFIEKCFRFEHTLKNSKSRDIVTGKLRMILKNTLDKKDQLELFKWLQSMIKILNSHESQMGDKVLVAISSAQINITDDEVFGAYISLFNTSFISNPADGSQFANAMDTSLKNEAHKKVNQILRKSLSVYAKDLIKAADLMEIQKAFEKGSGGTNDQKVAMAIIKTMKKCEYYEISSSCFNAYHNLVYVLLNVLAKIKNEPNVYLCCKDVKRHEIFNLIMTIFPFAEKLIAKNVFTKKEASHLNFHMIYVQQICSELKCDNQVYCFSRAWGMTYNTLLEMQSKKVKLMSTMTKEIDKSVKSIFELYELMPEQCRAKFPSPCAILTDMLRVDEYEKEQVSHALNSLYRCFRFQMRNEKFNSLRERNLKIMKNLFFIRSAARKTKYSNATDFIATKNPVNDLKMTVDELYSLEVNTIHRYIKNEDQTLSIANILEIMYKNEDLDLKNFVTTCQLPLEEVLKITDRTKFKQLNEKLEKYGDHNDVETSLALAYNHYALFQLESNEHQKKFSEVENSKQFTSDDCLKVSEKFKLEDEILLLELLEKSLTYLTNVVACFEENAENREKLISDQLIQRVIENISIIYVVRGIDNKELEAQNLLWHVFTKDSSSTLMLSSATVFLDNYQKLLDQSGNYIKLSKKLTTIKLDEVLPKSIEAYKKLMNEKTVKEKDQTIVINYLLSLWSFYEVKGKKEESNQWWQEYLKFWESSSLKDQQIYKSTFTAKIFNSVVEIKDKIFKKTATNILFDCVYQLLKVRSISADFANLFQRIYRNITTQAINYSINRMADMDLYSHLMLTLKFSTMVKGYYFKSCEYISLSILRHLNMEKLDLAQSELKVFSKLLEIKEEILIETPSKSMDTSLFNFDEMGYGVRDAAVISHSSLNLVASPQVSHQSSSNLIDQLKTFIHVRNCTCDSCKFQLLKFYFFQLVCHHSRLMWLFGNYETSKELNNSAFDRWRMVSQDILRSKEYGFLTIRKKEFLLFSIRWLFQVADTLIKLDQFHEAEEVYTEIELICNPSTPDYECMKQALYCRKESLDHLINLKKKTSLERSIPQLSYEEFLIKRKFRLSKEKECPTPSKVRTASLRTPATSSRVQTSLVTPATSSKKVSPRKPATADVVKITRPKKASPPKDDSVIFIDSSDDDKKTVKMNKPAQKVPAERSIRRKPTATLSQETPTTSSLTSTRSRRLI